MKLKKFLLLTSMFLFIIALMVVMPNKVFAQEEMSAEFKKLLNEDGKLVFDSIKPTTEDEWMGCFEMLFMYNIEGIGCNNLADDFSSFDFTINYGKETEETHRVEVMYNYDETIKEKLKGFINNFPKDIEYFKVQDLELVNYWVNNAALGDSENLDNYSGELKSYLNNNNVELFVDNRAGADEPFLTERLGIAVFKYNGSIYYINYKLGTKAEHIIYVPDDTESTKEAMMEAAQKRIDEYLGEEGKVKISGGQTVYDFWIKEQYELTREEWEKDFPNLTIEEFKEMGNIFIPAYEKFEDMIYVENITEDDFCYDVEVTVDEDVGGTFNVIVLKDSSKMIKPSYKTADMETNVEISSTSSSIPLDTCIKAEKLTEGEEYNKIIKVLDVKENETYDLKLYSNSTNDYVKKVDNGEFEVKIPVPDKFKGKTLAAYYVGANDKVEEYEVKVKDNYAIFTTTHFSIYTLAEKEDIDTLTNIPPIAENNKGEKDESPDTGNVDIIGYVSIITIISALGIIVLKRKK